MRRWLPATLAAVLMMAATGATARADLSIYIPDATITDNSETYLNVIISSTDMTSSQLYIANYSFVISSVGTSETRTLEFTKIQTEDYTSDPNYVFQPSYNANDPGGAPHSNVSSSANGNNDMLFGGDFNNDGVNSTVPSSSPTDPTVGALLIRLQLTTYTLQNPPTTQDQFTVSLDPVNNTSSPTAPSSSYFQSLDQFGDTAAMLYTSNTATVTVVSAVPEPGSFCLVATGGLTGGWLLRRRARRSRPA